MLRKRLIDVERARSLLDYDPETGVITWKPSAVRKNGTRVGVAGTRVGKYCVIYVAGLPVYKHRLAWALHYGVSPSLDVDHIDGDQGNDAIANLREADRTQNCCNSGVRKTNKIGLKGVSYSKFNGKYVAQIQYRKKKINLGYYDTPEASHAAYKAAAERLHGIFARAI